MNARLVAVALLAAFSPTAEAADSAIQHLDVSAVTTVRIVGEASSTDLTAGSDAPYEATLGGRRTGWFAGWYSSWFYSDCRTAARMRVEGETLIVEALPTSWLEPSDCTVELKANLPADIAVAIEQAASQVKLAGAFSAVTLDSKAADVTLDGHASKVSLKGGALRSQLTFDRSEANETIAISAHSLDAYLRFAPGTPVSYRVDSVAGLVDSALPNVMGAKPSIAIEGKYVRATIR